MKDDLAREHILEKDNIVKRKSRKRIGPMRYGENSGETQEFGNKYGMCLRRRREKKSTIFRVEVVKALQ